ncbi:class I SAM-dependent methyltransferase [Mesorhizobium sp. VK22B]|uniref:Class I SAM-dependent methyltransferase n=1 Tax=Mesorhizobium captivum TaxID=3072319 RepID=A0ABU4Z2D6_9HYPH|nr:class I SAM-dependent methyltransferase [Mesorhizobium sp. VK22B]MDX8493394.1 class I SAM-dependent methyltransferase [Mesorhizobium sp. VK22B]
MSLKKWAKNSWLAGPLVRQVYFALAALKFRNSADYWERRYRAGGTSGAGSANRLARFKADFLNRFVANHQIQSVVEFGCGDGMQLALAEYPKYLGLDNAPSAVARCRERFANDATKQFKLVDSDPGHHDLALSLDVVYHLVEDRVFDTYMRNLFSASERFVILYSSNSTESTPEPHVKHRRFTNWIEVNLLEWKLCSVTPNAYPLDPRDPDNTSFADFYVYSRY